MAKGGWYARMFGIQKDEVDATLVKDQLARLSRRQSG
jgi:hypothetical protein